MAAPRQRFPAQIETLVPANSCLAFSACSGLVTKNVFKGLGWYPKLGPAEHRAYPTTLADQHMTLRWMHCLHTTPGELEGMLLSEPVLRV